MVCILHGYYDAQPKMRFSLSPPPQKAICSSAASLTSPTTTSSSSSTTLSTTSNKNRSTTNQHNMLTRNGAAGGGGGAGSTAAAVTDEDAASDYNQWLHAMKLVARLPGGTPPEFRRKLWLSLADKYLKSKNVDWAKQREKCFCEEWREDDEELGIQIVKDLHRTGSNLCTGPAGSINQAKLKRILLGYARYNPEVGYCQGFNMLGALILQVMDKEEEESMKVMIYLVEGVLPTGYFYGSMGGLQADMGVFRELMQTRLPRLAKHLQRLQGPVENAFEPPLTNVFTMQWFLTMFCTCLPMSCVLRVWDLVLIEGSDVLLRTALVLWSLLEERVLSVRSADEFYGKMGSYSSELLNGHLIDSNGLIERVVKLGPIADLRQLRDKHLYNIAPLRHKQGMQLYYDDEETHSDEERIAVATVWGLNWGRRGSVGPAAGRQPTEQKDRMALDISLLKKQYDRLRERQKQAHVILTTACSTAARQGAAPNTALPSVTVNQLLLGRPAIITNKGKRVSAPLGAIPPARKPSLPAVLHTKPSAEKTLRRGETLLWRDTDDTRRRRDSLTWKEIKADRAMMREGSVKTLKAPKLRSRLGKSDSSSYSEDSDGEQEDERPGGGGSSTDTSLCDDDDPKSTEKSPKQKARLARKLKEKTQLSTGSREASLERQRPKSWAPSSHEIPFMLMGTESGDEKESAAKEEAAVAAESASKLEPLHLLVDLEIPGITSTSQLSPMPDMASYLGTSCISPLPTPRPVSIDPLAAEAAAGEEQADESTARVFDVSDDGVTNQYFERVNSAERPNRLELSYSLNEEETDARAVYMEQRAQVEGQSGGQESKAMPSPQLREEPVDDTDDKVPQIRDDNIPGENKDDYKEVLSMTIESHKPPPPTAASLSNASRKRNDPRRKTLTRSSTIDIEERFQALEHRFSQEQSCDKPKYIPSTAALEERFETLEKQLSAEKQRKELEEDPFPGVAEKSERIPTTADLESRFNALTKQMSSSESSSKAPIDLGDAEQSSSGSGAKEQKDSEKTSKLHKSEDAQSEAKETATTPKSESSKGTEKDKSKEEKEAEQPRLRKLPSTAELEDRFNALERKMSVQKSSPAKTKKEPPDEEPDKEEPKTRKETEEEKPKESPALKGAEESDKQSETVKAKDKTPTKTPEEKETSQKVEAPAGKDKPDKTVESEEELKKKPEPEKVENSPTTQKETQEESVKTPRKSPPSTEELEKRFKALEKQLSENSLKLLEAMREKSAAAVAAVVPVVAPRSDDSGSPRRLSTDTTDATTGKELVRYTQNFGELEELDSHKPINISINIKMMVNKDTERKRSESKPTTEDLARRLEQLEAQLVEERAKNGTVIPENETLEAPQMEDEASKKQEKDCHNQNVRSDETVRLEDAPPETIEPETVKETKTLENEEIALARAKEVEVDKTVKEEVVEPKVEVQEDNPKPEDVIKPEVAEETCTKDIKTLPAEKEKPKVEAKQCCSDEETISKESSKQQPEKTPTSNDFSKEVPEKVAIDDNDKGLPVDGNNKTVVLLMDNEPKTSRLRRLTRANTEELEDLFQALEKQLSERNLVKSEDGRLVRAESKPSTEQVEQAQAITDLTKEIQDFASADPEEKLEKEPKADKLEAELDAEVEEPNDYDWGPNPVKHHLKRKTVYLPSTKELVARFRSLERQIKLLEDVEKIDVEQRLKEIERRIKLQYSLSHEKDLNKYLELCEGKGLDELEVEETPSKEEPPAPPANQRSRSPARKVATKSPYTSPSRKTATKSPYTSPSRKASSKSPYASPYTSPYTSPSRQRQKTSPHSSPTRVASEKKMKRSPYTSPVRRQAHPNDLPISDDLEYKYRVLDLVRSKSKENLARRMNDPNRKPAIHPLEMLLDPSPDGSEIPTTGELEHRIRLLDEKLRSPVRPSRHKSRSRSPTIEDMKRKKMLEEQQPRTPVHNLERLVSSPGRPEPPTAEELDVRMRALEEEHSFDFKTQKDYKAFNQKLKDVISPSVSFEEFKAAKSREQSPRRGGATTPKSALRRDDPDDYSTHTHTSTHYRPTSPKVIRFRDEDEDYFEEAPRPKSRQSSERMVGTTNEVLACFSENIKILQRILKKTLADQPSSIRSYSSSSTEALDALGSRLMRETSPITRTGTHTGVPLRTTGENINDRLSSIKNTIKSIDTLCEEKPYQKEKCQRYIDSLFSDSLYFAAKKSSAEDLAHSRSESRGRTMQRSSDYTPSIRITSEHRSLGSAESRRSLSPLGRDVSPLHHRSHRDLSRDLSPRRRREQEEREERESSRVRRDNMLPNYFADNRSELSSGSSLTKFHKVDRQLEETCAKYADDRRSACRTPLSSPYETRSTATRQTTNYNYNYNATTTTTTTTTTGTGTGSTATVTDSSFPRPVSPYRQPYDPYRRPNAPAPAYQPAKLDIRHTTVTSTFYDRFLTEKQIEKQTLSRPPSRSPVVSPSITAKSYSDLYQSVSTTSSTSTPITTTTTGVTSFMSSSYAGPSSFSLPGGSNYSYLSTHTAAAGKSLSPGGSSSSDLRLRSTDNLLASTTTSASASTTTSISFVPYCFASSLGSRLSEPITSTSASQTTTSSLTYSTGVYNPMMSFTLREPLTSSSLGGTGTSSLLGQYQFKSSFSSGYTPKTPTEQDKP
ncbi:serine-rich adhesin for platelets-like isoform X9 [Drosophila subobscura]|uniref:serine-rich adhesin for platelets-like isoform X9 n=1 Tax=Drosophila subobscura TaxID=7241 RepID=UPI00155A0DCD|nr:serine-rich adhesin for platelets-like isoform X9 [Drosophila subobscura]